MNTNEKTQIFDFRNVLNKKKLTGLWYLMSDYHFPYLLAVITLAISSLAKTVTMFVLRFFADVIGGDKQYINDDVMLTFTLISVAFVLLAGVEGGLAFLSGKYSAFTAENVARRMRNFLFDHIQRLSFSYHNTTSTGELIERVTSDLDAVRRFFSEQAIGVGRIILLFFINWIAIMNISMKLALVSVVSIPPILLMSMWFFKNVTKAYETYQEQEAKLSTRLQENLNGVRVVKAFARQEYEIEKFEDENKQKFIKGKYLTLMHSLFWPLSDIVLGLQMLGGFLFAGVMVINNEISIGSYLAYVGLVVWLIWPIRNLGRLIVQTSTGLVSYGRLLTIISVAREDLDSGDFESSEKLRGEIEFKDVSFQYSDGDTEVLKGISFKVLPGQSIALIGSTGSGKTTLVNLLPRFHDYTGGSITIDGVELNRIPRKYLRSQIGIVEQEPFLFSRTIKENITYGVGKIVPDHEVKKAAKIASIHDVILGFTHGYDTVVGEKGVTLSGGQKQRTTIARTILKNPKILILDDSTSSVDTETEASIRDSLNSLMKDRTTFIIAHRIQSVINADLILVLKDGQIVQKGTHNELLKDKAGIYNRIFEIQTRIDDEFREEISTTSQGSLE